MAGLVFGELGRAPEVGDEVGVDGLASACSRSRARGSMKLEVEFGVDDETPTDEPAAA